MTRFRTLSRVLPLLALLAGCSGVATDETPSSVPTASAPALAPAPTQPVLEVAPAPRELIYLEVTPAAARELKAHVADLKLQRWWLRYTLKPGGCTGFQNKLDLDMGPPTADDFEYVANGIPCLVLKSQRHLVQGARIDFGEKGGERGFIVTAPHAVQCTKDAISKWIADEFDKRNPDLIRPTDR